MTTKWKTFWTCISKWSQCLGPNGSCLFAAGSPTDTVDSQNFWAFSTRQIAYLVAERRMPALLLRLLLQCAGDIEMNPGPVSTPTPTNCLRLMQRNANGISGKVTERLTFLNSNNVNIAAILETKLTNKSKPLKTPGWTAVRLHQHKNKGGGLLMLIKDTIPFVDITAALPQSAGPHQEQQGISIIMPNRQQLHIHNIYIRPRSSSSTGDNASIAHLHCNKEMWLVVGNINYYHSRWDTNTNEDERDEQLADEIDAADYTILNENEATRLPTSVWPPITSHYYQTGMSLPHWPAIICPSSSPSTPNCPRLMCLVEPTSISRKRTGHAMRAKQELSYKPRRPSGKQWIKPVAYSFRPTAFNTSNQPCRHQPNRSMMNET